MTEKLKNIQDALRRTLKANEIKEGTKTALKAEFFFLQGLIASADKELPTSLISICIMSGRSILTINPK